MKAMACGAIKALGWWGDRQLQRAAENPQGAQQEFLSAVLTRNRDTVFGRQHGFSGICDIPGYRRHVPIQDYEGFRPYIDRMVHGEPNVLTADPPLMFTSTSGTTGLPKLVPVTEATRRELSAISRTWFRYLSRDHPAIFHHRILTMVSPAVEGSTPCGLPVGTMSGLSYQRLPWLVRRRVALPYAVMTIADYDLRYFVALRLALQRSVSVLATANPSTLLRLAALAEAKAEALIRAIHDGTLGIAGMDPPVGDNQDSARLLDRLKHGLEADHPRARMLEQCVRQHGRLRLKDAWPELGLLVCWLGGSGGFQAALLKANYGAIPIRDPGYRASEATFTLTLEDGTPIGMLLLTTNFYEFIPEQAIGETKPPVLLAHEVEAGQTYSMVVTTASGLYRYDMNDIVRVDGFHRRAPLVAFVRKGCEMANITGEKLHANHILEATRSAQQEVGLRLVQVRAIANLRESRYDVLVESVEPGAGYDQLRSFLAAFDGALCRLNIEYAQKRRSKRLNAPHVYRMGVGWSEAQKRLDIAAGRRESQYKWRIIVCEWDEYSRRQIESEVSLE
jgi:hypothetical protein